MTTSGKGVETLEDFDARIRMLLPDQYQDSYNDVEPVPMRSAPLKFGGDGNVAWDEIWGSFCDLAMAGGPPHRGSLLEPGSVSDVSELPERYETVTGEICRGIGLVTGLFAQPSQYPGWIGIDCTSSGQSGWLARAITMENVSVGFEGMVLYLPAGPHYRLEKEIKNVVTAMAKTCHYWFGHTSLEQRRAISKLLDELETRSPLIRPIFPRPSTNAVTDEIFLSQVRAKICEATALRCSIRGKSDWQGLEFQNAKSAIGMMRALMACNVLARREGNTAFAAVNPIADPSGDALANRVISAYHYGVARKMFD